MNDERGAERFTIDATIFVEVSQHGDDSEILISSSVDLSDSGLQVKLDQSIDAGRDMNLCIEPRGGDPVFVVGRVVWHHAESDEHRIGLQLLKDPDSDLDGWHAAVETLSHRK